MSNQFIWQDRYNIGVEVIDREHRKLFNIVNRLLTFSEQEDKIQWVCQEGLKYFQDHAIKHFSEEEVYMASIHYTDYETHRRLHDDFRRKTLPALEKELARTGYSKESVSHFLGVCAGWLIGHTLTEDRAITGKTMSKWANLQPEEEQSAMRQTICWLLQDMFQLDAQVISERYGGEKFGKGIYYQLLFSNPDGQKFETILVFEEKLLIHTIGKIMGEDSNQLNAMILNATRYAARQFVQRVQEYFPNEEQYELQDESLLSYEQFQKVFGSQKSQYSLLFNTGGKGYFAYIVLAPNWSKGQVGTSIKAENAMSEVRKYLKQSNESKKRKLLVVDDSEVILKAMQELFGKEYHVAVAKSGMSAIRSMTLDRPDLVLLDYEMPVCDGSQVLEMIRAEQDFAELPVMIVTGKVNRENVERIMPMNPAGFLLKSLKPAEIKKNVDDFFLKKKD